MSVTRFRPLVEALEARELLATAIGMNIERVTDYSAHWLFTDAFKASRPWLPSIYNTATGTLTPDIGGLLPVTLDALGWPTQLNQTTDAQGELLQQILGTTMYDHVGGHYPAGIYTAQWDGTGTIWWGGDVQVTQTGLTPDGHHFALLNATPSDNGILMAIAAMSATDPIHDIHAWMPDYQGQSFVGQVWHPGADFSPFHPLFLERLKPFDTLRFMQDAEIITSDIQHWSDRRPWNYATQMTGTGFQNGIAPEYIIELANELHENVWINIPHMADDDYVANYAALVHATLQPGLQVYLEWSNEVWNGAPGFRPFRWILGQLQLPENAGVTFPQFVAAEDRRIFDIWSGVFADQVNPLVRVAAGFEQNANYTAQILQNLGSDFDAVSVAAYFGPDQNTRAGYTADTSVDQIISDTLASIPATVQFLRNHRALADLYSASLGRHIAFVAYEGGAALEGQYQPYQTALNEASVDLRMYDVYRAFLDSVNQAGLELMVNYEYTDRNLVNSPFGIYGSLNYQDQPLADAPKYRALVDSITSPPVPPGFAPGQKTPDLAITQPNRISALATEPSTSPPAVNRELPAGKETVSSPACRVARRFVESFSESFDHQPKEVQNDFEKNPTYSGAARGT